MGKILIIKGADFSKVAIGKVNITGIPVINIVGGIVTITCKDASNIYYTIDGKTPTKNSTKYISSFSVPDGTIVKAIAEFSDGSTSIVVSNGSNGSGGSGGSGDSGGSGTPTKIWYMSLDDSGSFLVNAFLNETTAQGYPGYASAATHVVNKPINIVAGKFKGSSVSLRNFVINKFTVSGDTATFDSVKEFTLTDEQVSDGIFEVALDSPITLSENEYLAVGIPESIEVARGANLPIGFLASGTVYYISNRSGNQGTWSTTTGELAMAFGYLG